MSTAFRPSNHPLVYGARSVAVCRKCKSIEVSYPAYPTDYFDCLDCGHSWEPTAKQIEKMQRGLTAKQLANL